MPIPHKILILIIPLLGACASVAATSPTGRVPGTATAPVPYPTSAPSRSVAPYAPPPPASGGFRAPRVMNLPGVDGVIGADAESLASQFGSPRLDVREGDARKLQFSGNACVLDIYLYPLSPGAKPTATYVDARRASDGLDVDRVSCIQALRGN